MRINDDNKSQDFKRRNLPSVSLCNGCINRILWIVRHCGAYSGHALDKKCVHKPNIHTRFGLHTHFVALYGAVCFAFDTGLIIWFMYPRTNDFTTVCVRIPHFVQLIHLALMHSM